MYLDAVELLLQGQDLGPLRGRLGELPLGQGQAVPGLEGVSRPLQGPQTVKEEGVEGDEDDEDNADENQGAGDAGPRALVGGWFREAELREPEGCRPARAPGSGSGCWGPSL